ncbi:hypothetical protein GCM10025867_03500 [Frondihabitans sucicola]|uniref:Transcriptional repressor n=1 Tax=Frondihabitans sucicola TaxID=1268041 RepID=A0ABM8GIA4_9MICO|nr:hypothetical protein GCM10025867_03500 [Frondihabitans sucicola]
MQSIDASEAIRAAGLRVTAPRVAAVDALRSGSHATADEVFERVATSLPGTSLQAMYVVLAALTGAGILRRIEPAGSAARYELRIGDNHHHVVCSLCGAIEDVDCVVGEAPAWPRPTRPATASRPPRSCSGVSVPRAWRPRLRRVPMILRPPGLSRPTRPINKETR